MSENDFPRIPPNVPGPVASRFARLRRHLEAFAENKRLALVPNEDCDFSGEAWAWNLYGDSPKGGPFCIQTIVEYAKTGSESATVVLYRWAASDEPPGAAWAATLFWDVDGDLTLKATLGTARKQADVPLPAETPKPKLTLVE